jgi:hypothetical protein
VTISNKQIIMFMVYVCYYQIHLNRLMASKRLPIQIECSTTDLDMIHQCPDAHSTAPFPLHRAHYYQQETTSSANFGIIE